MEALPEHVWNIKNNYIIVKYFFLFFGFTMKGGKSYLSKLISFG